jgi:predicted DNA-binding protein
MVEVVLEPICLSIETSQSVIQVQEQIHMGTFSVRLPAEIEKRLNKLSVRTGHTKAFYIKQALLEHLDNLENCYKTQVVQGTTMGEVLNAQQLAHLCEIQDDLLRILLHHETNGSGSSSSVQCNLHLLPLCK